MAAPPVIRKKSRKKPVATRSFFAGGRGRAALPSGGNSAIILHGIKYVCAARAGGCPGRRIDYAERKCAMGKHKKALIVCAAAVLLLLAASLLVGSHGRPETVQEAMRDAVLHAENRISLFGVKSVNPGLISAFVVTGILLVLAALIRVFAIPNFKFVPGRFQLAIEEAVGLFDNMAKSNSPHRHGFLGAYIFGAGAYIFFGTLFELIGMQGTTTRGHAIALPAPLSDVNAAIALGVLSYLVILSGGIAGNGFGGIGKTLKEFSLPISMSFRLFGALLSGLLVTELVYYYLVLSFVLPVIVAVLFTLIHALVQTYVLTMLTALYYGEVSEPAHKAKKGKAQEA